MGEGIWLILEIIPGTKTQRTKENGNLITTAPGLSDPTSEDDRRFENQSLLWKSSFIKALKKFDLPAEDDDYILSAILKPLKYYKKVFDEKMTEMQLIETFTTKNEQQKPDQDSKAYVSRLVGGVRSLSAEILRSKMIQKGIEKDLARQVLEEYQKELAQSLLETEDPQNPLKYIFVGLVMKK